MANIGDTIRVVYGKGDVWSNKESEGYWVTELSGKVGIVRNTYVKPHSNLTELFERKIILVCAPVLTFGKSTKNDARIFEIPEECCTVIKEAG
jgi:hypothetical protein